MASDDALVASFDAVEAARGDTTLTYFEFTTLAILHLLSQAELDVAILEVGLGGRLDAVNVIDADVAIVTSVDIDHTDYLGDTREADRLREGRHLPRRQDGDLQRPGAAAVADRPCRSHRRRPVAAGPRLQLFGRQAAVELWRSQRAPQFAGLSGPARRQPVAQCVAPRWPRSRRCADSCRWARRKCAPAWRWSSCRDASRCLPGRPTVVLDVAHNPHAAATLRAESRQYGLPPLYLCGVRHHGRQGHRRRHRADGRHVDHWCVTRPAFAALGRPLRSWPTRSPNSKPAGAKADDYTVTTFDRPAEAYANAMSRAGENDRIVVFGSFYTVAGVMAARKSSLH